MTEIFKHQTFGKYELVDKIGVGGMAEIYKAKYAGIDGFEKILVVKKILPSFADNTAFIKMLINEAKLTSNLQHANIVQIFDLGEIDDQYYIAMEYVDGWDLLKIMARASKLRLRIPTRLIVYILSAVARGLAYAHSAAASDGTSLNIIHRDVSPSNVIISNRGEIKLTDFGVARATRSDASLNEKTRAGTLKGKLGYMSPEQVTGKTIDHRSDLFSVGIVFFEMLTLKRLFLGKTDLDTMLNIRDTQIDEKFRKYTFISEDVRVILHKMLHKDRTERFQTGEEVHEALTDYLFSHQLKVTARHLGLFSKSLFAADPKSELATHFPDESFEAKRPNRKKKAKTDDSSTSGSQAAAVASPSQMAPTKDASAPPNDVANRESKTSKDIEGPGSDGDLRSASFRLQDQGGNVLGPISYTSLTNLLHANGVAADELVSIDNRPWVPLASVPSLAPLVSTDKQAPVELTPKYKGRIGALTLPKLIYRLCINKVNGRLRLANGVRYKDVYFKDGQPGHVVSNIDAEFLGEFLVRKQMLTREQLQTVLGKAQKSGRRLGDELLSMQLINPHQLFAVLSEQIKERLLEIFEWDAGDYFFYADASRPNDTPPIFITWFEILVEAMRSRVSYTAIERFFRERLASYINVLSNPYVEIGEFRLNTKEMRVYRLLHSHATIHDLSTADNVISTIGLEVTYRVLFLLLQSEFVELNG